MIRRFVILGTVLSFLPATVSTAAYAQAVKVALPANAPYLRYRTVSPSFIANLAAIRQINIRQNAGAGLKARKVKKHIKSVIGPIQPQVNVDDQFAIPEEDDSIIALEHLRPVAYASSPTTISGALSFATTDEADAWANNFFNTFDGNEKLLAKGEILVFAKKEHQFKVSDCRISIKRGTLILLRKDNNAIRLVNLKDTCRDAVLVSTPAKSLNVKPGHEVSICSSITGSSRLTTDGVGRRNKQQICGCCNCTIHDSEVSLHSIMMNNKLVNNLYHSSIAGERKLAEHVLKMTAALAHTSPSSAEYKWN
jgi:hypothetical protein